MPQADTPAHRYWKANLRVVGSLLFIWALVSLGLATVWVDPLDQIRIGGFKLGFWIAHQGSMMVFVALIWIYVFFMNRIDHQHQVDDDDD